MTTDILRPQPTPDATIQLFLSRHRQLLELERKAQEEQTRLLNSKCSPSLLEQRGLALNGLGVSGISIGLGGKSLIELHRPLAYHTSPALPPNTFRSGDPVRIEAHVSSTSTKSKGKRKESEDESAVEGVVYRVGPEKVVVAVNESKEIDLPERLRLLKLANSVTFDRMERTLAHLERLVLPSGGTPSPPSFNMPLVQVLLGKQLPTWKETIPPQNNVEALGQLSSDEDMKWFSQHLNDSQKESIKFCLKANEVACIHGPPGTGKTHTLVELIFQLLSRTASPNTTLPPRILITTPSNLALDNLLIRLHILTQQPPYNSLLSRNSFLRMGHPTRVHRDLVKETLDWKAANGDQGELLKDVGKEMQGHLNALGKKRGEKGAVKGKERGKKWEEVRELRKEYRRRESKVVETVVNGAQIVLATCHSAGSRQLNNMTFDVCIIDEATQAVEAVCWVPILKSKKLILAGDPQQLPPTIMSKENTPPLKVLQGAIDQIKLGDSPSLKPPRTLETTLFERLEKLYGLGIKHVLQVQYRMNEHIATFPSETLYESALISDASVAKCTLLELPSVKDKTSEDVKDDLEPTVVFFDTADCEFYERTEGDGEAIKSSIGEGSKSNENEAEIVARWAKKLISLGIPPIEIGIVTPYQAQVTFISSLLHGEYPEMTIGSIDGLQGQEREAIILSLVRSNPSGEVGFLGEYRRLNVAMTRAKRQLCVVGDSKTVSKGTKYLKKWMDWLEAEADVRWAGDVTV
uniref:DNA helicase n=1 Tax=Cryptococcus bacillisporus CA1280 TaxID=1296109 RepID=A0A0D0UAM3_CRYGA|nr:DNA helicase [Cryptococcus bacillisporus CA1280]